MSQVTKKSFNFAAKRNLPFYFVSASEGTNVVKVFTEAISMGYKYMENPDTWVMHFISLFLYARGVGVMYHRMTDLY